VLKVLILRFFAIQERLSRLTLPAYWGQVDVQLVEPPASVYNFARLSTAVFLSAVDMPSEMRRILLFWQ